MMKSSQQPSNHSGGTSPHPSYDVVHDDDRDSMLELLENDLLRRMIFKKMEEACEGNNMNKEDKQHLLDITSRMEILPMPSFEPEQEQQERNNNSRLRFGERASPHSFIVKRDVAVAARREDVPTTTIRNETDTCSTIVFDQDRLCAAYTDDMANRAEGTN